MRTIVRLYAVLMLLMISAAACQAQPLPPINTRVISYINRNTISWQHHPLNAAGYVANYQICRGDASGATVPIDTVGPAVVSYNDSTAGWAYEKEFFYTVRAIGTDTLLSDHSEEVMRFLPRAGVGNVHMETNTVTGLQYSNWDPYPGQWTDTRWRIRGVPAGNPSYVDTTFGNRTILRRSANVELPPGGPYYVEVYAGRPDWWGTPTSVYYNSYSNSLPFYVDAEVPFEDNASSSYFNSSPLRVMTEPLASGGVKAKLFSGHGGSFWRMRWPVRIRNGAREPAHGSLNAPCRVTVNTSPGEMAAGRSTAEVRVADEYGNELPSVVLGETTAGGWVTSFNVHFLASQDFEEYQNYWIYWANPLATAVNYGFSDSLTRTSQFEFSPWFSRKIMRGTIEAISTAAAYNASAGLPSPADDATVARSLGYNFPFYDFATSTIFMSTNGLLSFLPNSQSMNTWAGFSGASSERIIAPLWCNLMVNDIVPVTSGMYFRNVTNADWRYHRTRCTWRANRFNSPNEQYIFQAVLYRRGDIAFRYDTVNYNALWLTPSISGDNPLNVAPHHTAGISASDGSRWVRITDSSGDVKVTPLNDGITRNVIHYFQSAHCWEFAAFSDPTDQPVIAGATTVGHYDSRIFDGRSTDPTWTSVDYEILGNGTIDLYVRTAANFNFPDWDLSHLVGSNLPAGAAAIPLTLPSDRYLQYRVVFKKSAASDDPILRRIRFSVGYVTIDATTNQFNNTDVSQGQTFLASMTFSNFYSNPVNSQIASLVFDPVTASQTWTQITPHVTNVAYGASATIGFSVTVDENSGNLDAWTNINAYLEAGDGFTSLISSTAITQSRYRIREKANLQMDFVKAPFDKVNKGQGGIPVTVKLTNTSPWVPLIVDGASLTFSLGNYSWNPPYFFSPMEFGLFGQYFNTNTSNPPTFLYPAAATKVASEVNFNWGALAPLPEVGANYFGVRWTGYITPQFTETYTIYFFSDDGVRLWINGELIINSWVTSTFERSATVKLTAGVPASIVIDYYERTGNARAELRWESLSQLKQIIPTDRLRPALILYGNESINLDFTVAVLPDSPSGIAYVNATASGSNHWVPALRTDSSGAALPHTWIIQSPAQLAVGEIKAPDPVYRGQTNVPVDVEILNIGEADAQVASISLFFTLGTYTGVAEGDVMPVTINGGGSKVIRVLVSIAEDTATGTSWIDASVTGTDSNVGTPLFASGAAIPAKWTILAEKLITYSDATHLMPTASFVRPDSGSEKVYAKAENLVPLKEYAIRWYNTLGNEIVSATTIGFSDASGYLVAEYSYDATTPYGLYTVKLTNPVNTFSPTQTNFSIVTRANLGGSLQIPSTVSIGQVFPIYMGVTNAGGAMAEGMVPSTLERGGTGVANYSTGPLPGSIDLAGNSQATFTWNYTAAASGTFRVSAHAYGFEAGSSNKLSLPPGLTEMIAEDTFEEYAAGVSLNGRNAGSGWSGSWTAVAGQSVTAINDSMDFSSLMGEELKGGLKAISITGNNDQMVVRNLSAPVSDQELYVSMLMRFTGTQANNKFVALWFESFAFGAAPNIGIKMNRGDGSGVEDFFVRASNNEQYSTNLINGQTFLIVGRLSKSLGLDIYNRFELWVDPVSLVSPPPPDQFSVGLISIPSFSRIGIRTLGLVGGDRVDIAHVKIGRTWQSVVGDPLRSNECLIQTPAQVTINSLVATPTVVFLDQRNIQVQAALQNHGEADALIDLSEILFTPAFGSYTLASPTLPFVLPGNTTATWTFGININLAAPVGPATMSCRIRYADVNNPVPTIVQDQEYGWTIVNTRTICSRVSNFSSQQYIFNAGQTVFARCTGLPQNLSLKIRFYESSDPYPPVGVGVAIPTPLNSGIEGQVDHSYILPVDTDKLNQWLVVVDDGDDFTLGNIYGTQFFEVVRPPAIEYRLELGSSTCFVGDHIAASFIVNNISTWTTNVNHQFRNDLNVAGVLTYFNTRTMPLFEHAPGSVGSLTVPFPVSWPIRGVFVINTGGTHEFRFVLRAEQDSGLSGLGSRLRLMNQRWYYTDISTGGNFWQPIIDSVNSVVIYRKALNLASDTLDFGIVSPGDTSITLNSELQSTGNHMLERVNLNRVDLRKSVTEKIPGAYMNIGPLTPFTVATEGAVIIESSILVPFHQPAGTYVATMAVYEDHNNSGALDAIEPHNLVMAMVEVPSVAIAKLADNFIDLGVVAAGTDSGAAEIEIVGIGNLDLTDLKFAALPYLTFTPQIVGPLPYNGYATASVYASIPATQTPGVFFATGTLFDDIPGSSIDEFTIRWQVGSQSLKVTPGIFALGLGTPTYQIPPYAGAIENTGQLELSRLHGSSLEFINQQQPYAIATDNIALVPPSVIDVGNTENATSIVYVPGGSATGTYVATFTWFEDQNNNGILDSFEAMDRVVASFTVEEFYRLYSLKQTEDFGGVRPDTNKLLTIGVRNAGSLPIPLLAFNISPLSDGFDSYDSANITLPPPVTNIAPGELRYFDLSAYVPLFQKHGIFVGNMIIYGDLNGNNIQEPDEPMCELSLRIQIGDQKIEVVSPAQVNLAGTPASTTASVFVTVKNSGSLIISRARTAAEDLVSVIPGDLIASTAFSFSPGAFLGSMVPGQSRTFSIRLNIPFSQTPGIYNSTLWTWEDANNDGIRQPEETAASVPILLNIAYVKELRTSPTSQNLGFVACGDVASVSFLAQSVGNTSLDDVRWHIVSLVGPFSSITAGNITFAPDPIGFVATPPVGLPVNQSATITVTIPTSSGDGLYLGNMVLYEDDFDPAGNTYNSGLEPSFSMPVQVHVVSPNVGISPDPIVIAPSNPTGQTASASFVITNSSLINYRHLKYTFTSLVSGANSIPVASITMIPSSLPALTVGQTQNVQISVNIASFSQPPGIYEGNISVWDDRNNNNVVDSWETSAPALIRLTVNSFPRIELYPPTDPVDLGKIARNNFSGEQTFSLRNVGNIALTNLIWNSDDMYMGAEFIPAASITLQLTHNALSPAQFASVTVSIAEETRRISPLQELGVYGDALQLLSTLQGANDTFRLRCEIIAGGPQGLDPGSVYQQIGSESFPLHPAALERFVLSAYICPGSGSAQLGFLLTDDVGIQTGYSGVNVDASGNLTPVPGGTPIGITDRFSQFDTSTGETHNWYRIYMVFDYHFNPSVASHSYILLQNTSPLTASHSVWIDGIQLEKTDPQRSAPTSWTENKKLVSPNNESDLSGDRRYFQW